MQYVACFGEAFLPRGPKDSAKMPIHVAQEVKRLLARTMSAEVSSICTLQLAMFLVGGSSWDFAARTLQLGPDDIKHAPAFRVGTVANSRCHLLKSQSTCSSKVTVLPIYWAILDEEDGLLLYLRLPDLRFRMSPLAFVKQGA